jgi:cation:H+ antiporter
MSEPTASVPVSAPFAKRPQAVLLLTGFFATSVAGVVLCHLLDDARAGLIAAAAFGAVVSAAMLISWGAEAAQFFMSQGFAVALIALLQVMPEFMVEAVIAWHGEIRNMFANATGSNRLLIGLGWPLIYFTADISSRLKTGKGAGPVRLRPENILEVLSLLVASSYYLKFLLLGSLTVFDGVFLCAMYVGYMLLLSRLPEEDEENKEDLLAPPRLIVELKQGGRVRGAKLMLLGLFLTGGGVMIFVAEPFVDSLKHVASAWGLSEFVFIQWVAPFLSEFPEKVTAFYWSRTVRLAPMALLNMVSSTVSQFTLLVGMIPIVYAVAVWSGNIQGAATGFFGLPIVPMVDSQHDLRAEVFLSWAMTLYGCALLAKLRFSLSDAIIVFSIWIAQFFSGPLAKVIPIHEERQHVILGVLCIVLAVGQVVKNWGELRVRQSLRETFALMKHGRSAARSAAGGTHAG